MRKLLLHCRLSLGDIVMLTAAVRDLHRAYPGRFLTDVRTSCAALWEHNPYLAPLAEADPEVEHIECSYPLINQCNTAPYHCLHGFIDFLNQRLGLAIRPTAFGGDLHLSAQEKAWYSQVHEVAGEDLPFWLVAAGGKYDVPIKWWHTERYQQVVDHFRGRVQFVQVGDQGHHHPRLQGAIDLRGQTDLRQLVRLVYHAQGVLCPVTGLMHLAAAVETRPGRPAHRACVVVAGGREPVHWEAYPHHQFIHTLGALACCSQGGCWRDRTVPLRDGDLRDRPARRCLQVRQELPRCMDLIGPDEVIRRIETYYRGGNLQYLTLRQQAAAAQGVRATARNRFDRQKLTLHNAGLACERFLRQLSDNVKFAQENRMPLDGLIGPRQASLRDETEGGRARNLTVSKQLRLRYRGIVLCCQGKSGMTPVLTVLRRLRALGSELPVQVWHLGKLELSPRTQAQLSRLGAECVDALRLRRTFPVRCLGPAQLKPYALLHAPFRQLLLLEGDRLPSLKPERLFASAAFRATGALFWATWHPEASQAETAIWRSCGLRRPRGPGMEVGSLLVDKARCWRALRLALWFHEQGDFYFEHLQSPARAFLLAFRKVKQRYALAKERGIYAASPLEAAKGSKTSCGPVKANGEAA